ncbi:hypothetical protein [Psittacicella gerlachiana]|uniref:Uncharacterized protein n=1 Tax=Psittacicella gerlachiana TaxID=2028574 RepID=A0A3A1YC18_9GAMM|nr:hypothetical protein [Psittacicella gerlachiana]RIY35235.1 hypothetical protein CKF59_03955 [Psittacicella gerlachiana]
MTLDTRQSSLDPRAAKAYEQEFTHEQAVNDETLEHEFSLNSHGRLAINSFEENHPKPKRRIRIARMATVAIVNNIGRGLAALVAALVLLGSVIGLMAFSNE